MSMRFARALMLAGCTLLAACDSDNDGKDPAELMEELPESVSVVIDEKGGTVRAKGVTLEIPKGALTKPVTITAKKAADQKVRAPAKAVSAVYEFGPKGTVFEKDIKVSLDLEKDEPRANVYYTKPGSDSEFDKLASVSKEGKVSASTKHFSLAFAGIPEEEGPVITEPNRVAIQIRDRYRRATAVRWLAVEDAAPGFRELTPQSPGSYEVEVDGTELTIALVCEGAFSSHLVVRHAPTDVRQQEFVVDDTCMPSQPDFATLNLSVTPPAGTTNIAYAHAYAAGSTSAEELMPTLVAIDSLPVGLPQRPIVAARDPDGFLLRLSILDETPENPADQTLTLDLAQGGVAPGVVSFTITNASSSTPSVSVSLNAVDSSQGLSVATGPLEPVDASSYAQSFYTVPSSTLGAVAHYQLTASSFTDAGLSVVQLETTQTEALSLALPAAFSPSFSESSSASFFQPQITFTPVADASAYSLHFIASTGEASRFVEVSVDARLVPASAPYVLSVPDLNDAPGFDAAWQVPRGAYTNVSGSVRSEQTRADQSVLRTVSEAYQLFGASAGL